MTYKSSDSVERKYYKYSDGGHSGAYILPNATTYLSNFSLLGGSNDIGVKASSYYSSYYPWHVFDNTTSAWVTNTGYPVWIAWSFFTNDDTAVIRPSILSITNAGANFPREGTLDYSDNGEDWTTITSWASDAGANTQWFITVPTSYDGYHKYHRLNITAGSHATVDDVAKIQVSFYLRSLVPGTSSDYNRFEDKKIHRASQKVNRIYCKLLEEAYTSPYTFTVTSGGNYLIELIGGGGGAACKQADSKYQSAPTGTGSGGSGGYFKGIVKFDEGDRVSFMFGTGGSGRYWNTYNEFSAYAGTESTLSINDNLVVTTNGGQGGSSNKASACGTTIIHDFNRVISVITDIGINGSYLRGGEYSPPLIPRTMSPFSMTDTGYGSGGGCTVSGKPSSGMGGAMRMTMTYTTEPEEYDYYIDESTFFGFKY